MVPCGSESLSVDARFAGFVPFEQIESDAVEQGEVLRGEVLRGVSGALAAQILAEGHVQHPLQFVFDAPVPAYELVQSCSIRGQAADGVAGFLFGFATMAR